MNSAIDAEEKKGKESGSKQGVNTIELSSGSGSANESSSNSKAQTDESNSDPSAEPQRKRAMKRTIDESLLSDEEKSDMELLSRIELNGLVGRRMAEYTIRIKDEVLNSIEVSKNGVRKEVICADN